MSNPPIREYHIEELKVPGVYEKSSRLVEGAIP